ncbi:MULTISPECIES: linear amide C-N hydrolase [Romboutsia]|uniref:linear amide C-N hydrolase n=1 Tax=Romboutsia TaxID=1501226 RepID=UPI00232D437F|nr:MULTISPECIES: linear amide C-N hydrolase [Romboutsia]MDB8790313.1 linear amide C-N hydrolase [Romboutsia sp. 1001216sp1]MDB8800713.1 linear amide C-N hydrolase [Romboutsia sp. 1001216sp1]MDB8804007.1 linear amide C-N hydrolase [Romboutsia sp. 1001216sp1]MDB8807185.1 linear amide C-N hydrolase [Romboutsia sp. 1001216sp1]MDB8812112.1 linear amide C-N hydrolase [Romboutsia sp. 1001216sp1]
MTLYKACMCQETGVYYYTTYNNSQITAIDIFKENLDADTLKSFKYINKPVIHFAS